MKRFINNLSTSAKLILSFGILLALLAGVIATVYMSLTSVSKSETDLRNDYFEQALQLENLTTNMNFNMWKVHEMLLTNDPSELEATKNLIQEHGAKNDDIVTKLKALNPDTTFQDQLQKLESNQTVYRQTRDQIITLILAGKVDEAQQLIHNVAGDQYEAVRTLAVQMGDEATVKIDQQLALDQQAAQSATLVMMVIGTITLVLAIVLVVTLNQAISKPLTNITRIAGQIGGGDLTVNLPEEQRRDEIGALSEAFSRMLNTLQRSTSDLTEAVGLLGSSASEILAATTQVATGTAESATSINETTTTVEEVRQAAQLSSQKAQSVSDNAQRVVQVSQSGQKAVEETAAGMDRIREQMETIAQTVVRLSEQSQSIGGIIASVTDLADQSNLLAVNAAIEAARAGEQGRGFAVVAQEIKSLAEQSKLATTQVRGILSDVQKATGNAVMATEQGSKAVDAGVKQAAQAGEAIRVLTEASDEAVQTAIQIVASSQQQVVGMNQIGVAMENINQAGTQNAASMKQMEVAAQNLHELGEKLKELVAQFKV